MPDTKEQLVRIRLDLTPEQREVLRVMAFEARLPMSKFAKRLVVSAIEEDVKRRAEAVGKSRK